MRPAVSIVILTCNQRDYTLRCLRSLSDMVRRRGDIEVILVDNGSLDGTAEAVRREEYYNDGIYSIIGLERNIGVAPGRNVGIRAARGSEYVMILDNDTIFDPDALDSMLAYMDSDPTTGIIGPRLVSPGGATQTSFKPFPGIVEKIRNVISDRSVARTCPDKVTFPFYVIGACQLIRRKLIDKIGLLDEKIFFGPEDADYCMRARKAGYRVAYLPQAVIVHDWQRSSARRPWSPTARRHMAALLYFYMKHRRLF